jgi:H+-translocating NAD(P) transhydrogenase subunit alpha
LLDTREKATLEVDAEEVRIMVIGVPKEVLAGERRVALIPERVAYLVKQGRKVLVESGAGAEAFFDDAAYARAGAQVVPDARAVYAGSDLVVKVRAPAVNPATAVDEITLLREGLILVALLDPLNFPQRAGAIAQARVTSFSMDAMPRTTRAQSMDVLSSMATVAGYRAALLGASQIGKFFPLLMTAAGTVTPAKVLILGAGVAGLQAIATARRLGAVVQAFDTRPAVREQVESLGATFLTLALQVEHAQDAGGYARQLDEADSNAERDLLAEPVRLADVIITTAAIPGARAPILITEEMVASMHAGSVIVDLSAATGGNCACTVPGQQVIVHGVVIEGPINLPATMPVHASQLFSRNLCNFVEHLLANGVKPGAMDGGFDLNLEDEITRETCITYDGRILHRIARERLEALEGASVGHV